MPFTFSHPAIILPMSRLPRRFYSLTGLIAGTIVPDFEFFFRMDTYSLYSHDMAGLLYFDLPVGILLCFAFHVLVKKELIANLPVFFRERSGPVLELDWNAAFRKHFPVICISILIGAASHLFWDAFTHDHGYFVQKLGYRGVSLPLGRIRIYLYSLLQYGCSLLGLLFIYLHIKAMPVNPVYAAGRISYVYWIFVFLVCAGLTAARWLTSPAGADPFGKAILTLVSAFLAGLVLAPVFAGRKPFRVFSL